MAADDELAAAQQQIERAEQLIEEAERIIHASRFLCPHCQHDKSEVTGGIFIEQRQVYRRYRRCLQCRQRYSTTEGGVRLPRNKKSTSCESPDTAPSL